MQGSVILVRQKDQPGIIAGVSRILGEADVNISFMTVRATAPLASRQHQRPMAAAGMSSRSLSQLLPCAGECRRLHDLTTRLQRRSASIFARTAHAKTVIADS